MGFPVGYTLFLPKLLIHALTFIILIKKLVLSFFIFFGLPDFLEPEFSFPTRPDCSPDPRSVPGPLTRELLPVAKFSDLVDPPESCAVCLHEFDGCDEIRRLANCRHIFHLGCLDRWMDHDQRTCPLCRTQIVPDDLRESFNEQLWAECGISEFYDDYLTISSGF